MNVENLRQWLKYGGGVSLSSCASERVRASVSDPGGTAIGWVTEADSLESALEWAEKKIGEIIHSNKEIVERYKTGEIPWPDEPIIRIPGLPPVENPTRGNAVKHKF